MFTNKGMVIAACIIFVVGIGIGVWAMHTYSESDRSNLALAYKDIEALKSRPLPVQEKVETKTVTQIQYVDKVVDPATGKQEKTDVEANIDKPKVNVKVNGQQYAFNLREGETQKFQNGKLVLDQASTVGIDLDVRPMVNALAAEQVAEIKKKYDKPRGTGILWTNQGTELIHMQRLLPSLDLVAEATVPDPQKHIGAGLIYRY